MSDARIAALTACARSLPDGRAALPVGCGKCPAGHGLRTHPNFKREEKLDGETRFRVVLSHRNDPSRELVVTVLVFDVPK